MKRIMVIGSGGSGKSTFARKLGEQLNIDVIHLDSILWKPYWEMTSREEQREILSKVTAQDSWIIDGNYTSTIDERLSRADTVIFLDMNRYRCLYNALKRRVKNHGKVRADMAEGCVEKIDLEFLSWIYHFPENKRPGIMKKIDAVKHEKTVLIFKNYKDVDAFLNR